MPIVVRHTPVGALGRAAVMAGQAQASQLQASRDIQLTSLAMAARSQAEARLDRNYQSDRAFAKQQAATSPRARRQPETDDALAERQQLNRAVADAKATGAYTPVQLAQMQIAANLGDKVAFRGIMSKVEEPSARRQELGKQAVTVEAIANKGIGVIQRRIDALNKQMEKNFSPEAQQFLRENPRFAPSEVKAAFTEQQRLEDEIRGIQERAGEKLQALGLGVDIPQQIAFGMRQEARLTRAEAVEQKRVDKQVADAEKLTAVQRANISTVRRHSKEIRDDIDREITLLKRDFGQYEKESDAEYAARERSIWDQVADSERKKMGVFTEEKDSIQKIMETVTGKPKTFPKGHIYTTPDGRRFVNTGELRNGSPVYEPVE